MHACPRCGYDCDCNGDWDDCEVMSQSWVIKNCSCDCEYHRESEDDDDYDDGDYDDYDPEERNL